MPRMIDLIRASALPSNLMQSAAKGALSVPPREMVEILVHLAVHNKVFGEQARLTLAGWDETVCRKIAADPGSPREVLDYLVSPQNLRPPLLPLLLENASINEAQLAELSASSSREVVEAMLKSPRVNHFPDLRQRLVANPNLTVSEAARLKDWATTTEPPIPVSTPALETTPAAQSHEDAVLAPVPPDEPSSPDSVLDEALMGYLTEHAGEISAEEGKLFQPIGGFYDEFVPGAEEQSAEAVASAATAGAGSATSAAAAAKRAPIVKKSHLSAEQERGTALQKIAKLDIKGRIQLAMKGTKEERSLLIRDGTKIVALAVLESPKISESEVEKFASQKNVLEAVLRSIPMKRRFVKHYGIVRNLVFNPRTPIDVSLGLIKNLLIHDLKNLASNKEVSETIRKLAFKMFRQKMDTSKKSKD